MAMSSSSLLPLLPLLLCCFFPGLHAGEKHGFFHAISVDGLLATGNCSTPKGSNSGGSSLKIHHRYGPCSMLGGEVSQGLHKLLLLQDQARVESLHQRLRKGKDKEGRKLSTKEVDLPASSGRSLGSGNYVVTVGIGTPKKDQTVMFDTGSNVCWVQCKPCANHSCHEQRDPVFDPSGSNTYRSVSCSDIHCRRLDIKGCSNGSCLYDVMYGDNSSTAGVLSRDSLTLTSTDVFPDFTFGCGQNNQGLFGKTAGLFGLGRDNISLVSQTWRKYGGIFSYCLPVQSTSTGGYLSFGGTNNSSNVSYTPMLTHHRDPSLYALELSGISVGGELLNISRSVFSTAGMIVDSGTVVTRLPPAAYAALRSAFRSGMSRDYPLGEAAVEGLLDTCYNLTAQTTVSVPTISLHFGGGVDVELGVHGIFVVLNISQVCLGFAGNRAATSIGIIGNNQQRGLEMVYDLAASRIGFGARTCI